MSFPASITVRKNAQTVFEAHAGRYGRVDSASRDFVCFASPIIGAAYSYLCVEEAAQRIASDGFETTFVYEAGVTNTIASLSA